MIVHRLAFSSSIGHCGILRRCVQLFGQSAGYSGSFISALELTVHEAFVNAVKHGNRSDPELPVVIILRDVRELDDHYLHVEVADCGKGFAFNGRRDFSEAGDPLKLSGRGVPLIVHFADSIRLERRAGGSVLLLRYIPY